MTSSKTEPSVDPMNRYSWQAQKTIRDVDQWVRWTQDTADKFLGELLALQKNRSMPDEDRLNLIAVREQLTAFSASYHPLERAIHKATGRRIQRAQRRP